MFRPPTHESESVYVACHVSCRIETEGLVKVTSGSHARSNKSGNISETVQDRDVVTCISNSAISDDLEADSPFTLQVFLERFFVQLCSS